MPDFGDLNPDLIDAVKGFEGYSPKPQWDYQQYSSGWGTKARPGEAVDRATHEQRLRDELEKAATFVDTKVPGLPQGVRDAMISLTFNAGGNWVNAGLGQKLREGDYTTAQQLFTQYNKAGGKPLQGLTNRRNTEAAWFNNEDGTASGSPVGNPVQANDLGALGAAPYGSTSPHGTPRMDQSPGLLQGLGQQDQQGGGLFGGVGGLIGAIDPQKMAYLGMIAKGLDPYSSIDPNSMLKNAQAQQQHQQDLALRQRRQLFEEGQAGVANDFRERQLAQQNVTPAAKAAMDFGLTPGTSEYKDFMTSFYQLKGQGYTPVTIKDASTGEDRTIFQDKQGNFRTPEQLGIAPSSAPASGANAIPPPPPGADPKEWRKKQTDMRATEEAQRSGREATATRMVEDIGRAKDTIDNSILPTTGLIGGQLLSNIGGTDAHKLNTILESIGSNISFDKLQKMRQESPTGGALGNVSDKDIALLKSTMGSIRQSQSADDLKFNLNRLQKQYNDIIHGPGGGAGAGKSQTPTATKTINGKTYNKIGGQWYED